MVNKCKGLVLPVTVKGVTSCLPALGRAAWAAWSNAAWCSGPGTTVVMSTRWQMLTRFLRLQITLLFSDASQMFGKNKLFAIGSALC